MKIARSVLSKGNVELLKDIEKVKALVAELGKKYGVSSEHVFRLVKGEAIIPVSIFRKDLTVLETIVKYLKENLSYSLHEISELIRRDERNVWHIYASARKKVSAKLVAKGTKYFVPVSVFTNKQVSALEALAVYLRDVYRLSYHEIATLLKRDERNVWTVCSRARAKIKKPF